MAKESEDKLANELQAEWTPESERAKEEEASKEEETSTEAQADPKELERIRQESEAFQQLASDEQVNRLIQARTQGQDVEVISKDELEKLRQGGQDDQKGQNEGQDVSDNNGRDIEELSNAELLEMAQAKTLKGVEDLLNERLKPVQEKVSQVDQIEQDRQREKVSQQVEQAKQKYSDFEDHKKKILELSNKHPSLDVDSLYWLAKKESGALETMLEPTDQEKPTGGGAAANPRQRGQSASQIKRDPGNSRKSFQGLLEEVL